MLFLLTRSIVYSKHIGVSKPYGSARDAGLIDAEAEIARLLDRAGRMPSDEASAALLFEVDRLDRAIATTPPRTLGGAAVKLRRLLDPETGMAVGANPSEITALAQVLALLERRAGRPTHRTRPTLGGETRP